MKVVYCKPNTNFVNSKKCVKIKNCKALKEEIHDVIFGTSHCGINSNDKIKKEMDSYFTISFFIT